MSARPIPSHWLDTALMVFLLVCIVFFGAIAVVLAYALALMPWALIGAGIYFGLRGIGWLAS